MTGDHATIRDVRGSRFDVRGSGSSFGVRRTARAAKLSRCAKIVAMATTSAVVHRDLAEAETWYGERSEVAAQAFALEIDNGLATMRDPSPRLDW